MGLRKGARRDWSAVQMSPEARALYENEFLPAVRRQAEEVAHTPLSVLVWGPGPSGRKLYRKRLQIRGELRLRNIAAVFSEEITRMEGTVSQKAEELFQAAAADFIIIIQASPGSTAEAHDFGSFISTIGSKMLIFIDERCRGGYSFEGALKELNNMYNNVRTYEFPRDIDQCNLLTAVLDRVSVLQLAKWRSRKHA